MVLALGWSFGSTPSPSASSSISACRQNSSDLAFRPSRFFPEPLGVISNLLVWIFTHMLLHQGARSRPWGFGGLRGDRAQASVRRKTDPPSNSVRGGLVPFRKALERASSEQSLRRDVPVLDICDECRLHPRRLRLLDGFGELGLGLTTVSSCLRIWLEAVRDHPGPDLPHVDQVLALFLAE